MTTVERTDEYASIQPGTTVFERINGSYVEWYVTDLVWATDGVSAILMRGGERATVDADRLAEAVAQRDTTRWTPALYDGDGQDGATWVPHPRHTGPNEDAVCDVELRTAPDTPSKLTFEKIEGRGSRTEVNNFLNGNDGLVFHELGGVQSWTAAFVARYDEAIVSVITLHYYHPSKNGEEIAITRLANHPSAPPNTSTWMIARARKWAERVGHGRVATYSGVGDNEGTCYDACGFEKQGEPVEREGKDWKGEKKGKWMKQKWVYDLDPATYRDKSPEWAVESVAAGVLIPNNAAVKSTPARRSLTSAVN
jgi:hypothetical protein